METRGGHGAEPANPRRNVSLRSREKCKGCRMRRAGRGSGSCPAQRGMEEEEAGGSADSSGLAEVSILPRGREEGRG